MSLLQYLLVLISSSICTSSYGSNIPMEVYASASAVVADSSSYNIVSSYNKDFDELLVQFNLDEDATVGLELYQRDGQMIKLWNPVIADKGVYRSTLSLSDIPEGTYLLNVIINKESFQQALFKY